MFTVKIKTGNSATQTGAEIARILKKLADLIEFEDRSFESAILKDINGNTVGDATWASD